MSRNMEKLCEKVRMDIPAAYDINTEELFRLRDMILTGDRNKMFQAVCMAFDYGFVCGNRATRAGKVKNL